MVESPDTFVVATIAMRVATLKFTGSEGFRYMRPKLQKLPFHHAKLSTPVLINKGRFAEAKVSNNVIVPSPEQTSVESKHCVIDCFVEVFHSSFLAERSRERRSIESPADEFQILSVEVLLGQSLPLFHELPQAISMPPEFNGSDLVAFGMFGIVMPHVGVTVEAQGNSVVDGVVVGNTFWVNMMYFDLDTLVPQAQAATAAAFAERLQFHI